MQIGRWLCGAVAVALVGAVLVLGSGSSRAQQLQVQRQETLQAANAGPAVAGLAVDPQIEACRTAAADETGTAGPSLSFLYLMSHVDYWQKASCKRLVADFVLPSNSSSNLAGEPTSVAFDVYRYPAGGYTPINQQNCSSYAEYAFVYRKNPGQSAFQYLGSSVAHAAWTANGCRVQEPAPDALDGPYAPPAAGQATYRIAAGIKVGSAWQNAATVRCGHHLTGTDSVH